MFHELVINDLEWISGHFKPC